MKLSSIKKSTLREIKQSFGRFAAILAIVALGVGLFAGLKVTKQAMVKTTGQYLEETRLFDYMLLSTLGFEEQDLSLLREEEVLAVEGAYSYDILYESGDGRDGVLKAHSMTTAVNQIRAVEGRLPEKPEECVVDVNLFPKEAIGQTLKLSGNNDKEDLEHFAYEEYTIVGLVQSPYYIQFERGNTALGSGRIDGFVYLLPQGFAEEIYTEVYVKFTENFPMYSQDYQDFMEEKQVSWEELTATAARRRFDRIVADAKGEIEDARKELLEKKEEGEQELSDAWEELLEAKQTLADGRVALEDAETELDDARKTLRDKENELLEAKQIFADKEKELRDAEQEVANGWTEWQKGSEESAAAQSTLDNLQLELAAKREELRSNEPYLSLTEEGRMILAQAQAELAVYESQLEEGRGQLAQGKAILDSTYMRLSDAQNQISSGREELEEAKKTLADGERQLRDAEKELYEGEKTLAEKKAEYEEGLAEYEDGLAEYEDAHGEFTEKIEDAEAEIADAEKEISKLHKPETYVLGRETNVGYVCFENDSAIVEGIANVFPVFFFLVAALVCMTTMNRMVEEQRTQIGVLKALGYSNGQIMFKYAFYSGTAAMFGALIGYFGGTWLFPRVLWTVYGIMYCVDDGLIYVFNIGLAAISIAVSLLCSVGTTWISCRVELREVAAQLMRPKSPKAGKRVFLEYFPFLWKRLGFLRKVSLRNVFRYKKRLLMMVLGISGCTALLVTGFGIKDSIANVATQQFQEIQIYDIGLSFSEQIKEEEKQALVAAGVEVEDSLFLMESSVDIITEERNKAVSLIVTEGTERISAFLDLHTEEKEAISYPEPGEAVITHKIAGEFGIEVGDRLVVRNDKMQTMELLITGINENFLYNYVYIDSETYRQQFLSEPEYKTAYINVTAEKEVHELSAALMKLEGATGVTVNKDIMERISSMLKSLNLIVVVIIICAAGLAFIVLYNLTNINITERIREIATIKVLGFYKGETSKYVFRENLVLTFLGALVGLVLGKALHVFVMNEVNVDMIAFDIHILPISYIYSVLLTFLFAVFVNKIMGRKLEKISMTESLKSID